MAGLQPSDGNATWGSGTGVSGRHLQARSNVVRFDEERS